MTESNASTKQPKPKKPPVKKPRPKKAVTARKKKSQSKASADTLKMLTRQTWALDLKRQGLSYRRISARLKELKIANRSYSSGLAYRDVMEGMKRMLADQKELAELNLRMDLERVEELMMHWYPLAVPPDDSMRPPDMQAGAFILALIDKREKLLNYKSLYQQPEEPQWNITVDWSKFTTQQILEIRRRISQGEKPIDVFTEVQQQAKEGNSTSGSMDA